MSKRKTDEQTSEVKESGSSAETEKTAVATETTETKSGSNVPAQAQTKTSDVLQPVEDLAEAAKLKPWFLAGLRKTNKWAAGKKVTQQQFDAAVERFNTRRQGSGN